MLHAGTVSRGSTRALGCDLRADLLASRITPERYHNLHQALEGVLRRRRVSGKTLEIDWTCHLYRTYVQARAQRLQHCLSVHASTLLKAGCALEYSAGRTELIQRFDDLPSRRLPQMRP